MRDWDAWPALPLHEWQDTYRTLHLWTQIVGKIRMTLHPPLNHWWHVPLYISARGLTTGPIPFAGGMLEIEFDFLKHQLRILTSRGDEFSRPLAAESVARFYAALFEVLARLGIAVTIDPRPQEMGGGVPFDQDRAVGSYDSEYAARFWRILVSSTRVIDRFRGTFLGKASPVHFFWGSFDLAHTRFSGRLAPRRHGAISGPAYSHEVWSAGFWPGGGGVDGPAFYAYTVPKPDGLENEKLRPEAAAWNSVLGEFILMYDAVRESSDPERALRDFLESSYQAGANLAGWNRAALEAAPERIAEA